VSRLVPPADSQVFRDDRPSAPGAAALWPVVALAACYLVLLTALTWLMLGPPESFRGFARDTATAEAPRRVALYADALHASAAPLSERTYLWGVRATLVGLFLLHGAAVWRASRSPAIGRGERRLWYGLPVGAMTVALAYPPTSADLFYYAMAGHLAADRGVNPYLVTPATFPTDPLVPLNYWTGITSPYGPLWTTISRGVVLLVGDDPLRVSLAFKALAAVAAIGLAVIVARVTSDLWPGEGLTAYVLVGWHPILIVESAGTGHHDALIMLPAMVGLGLLGRERTRSAVLALALSALMKPVTVPLLALAALARLRERRWSGAIRGWAGDLLAVSLLVVVVSVPYWAGGAMLRSLLAEPGRLVSNPFYGLLANLIGTLWGPGARGRVALDAGPISKIVVAVVVVMLAGWSASRLWRTRPRGWALVRTEATGWAAVTIVLALVPSSAHPWYAIWTLGPVALVTRSRGRALAAYLLLIGLFALLYHTDVAGG
jgi:hypothetical protein